MPKFSKISLFFKGKKKKKKNCKDLGVGKDLTKFAKNIHTWIFEKKNHILIILIRFNGKS
jgi:hypothetical protein